MQLYFNFPGVACPKMADIILVLDISTSILTAAAGDSYYWRGYYLGFISSLVEAFPIAQNLTRIGVVQYNEYPYPILYLNQMSTLDNLQTSIGYLQPSGTQTDMASALRLARNMMQEARSNTSIGW